jgi:hypothetical protein
MGSMITRPEIRTNLRCVSGWFAVSVLTFFAGGCSEAPLGPLTVTELATPAGDFSGQAHLAAAPDGTAVLSWLEPTTGDGMGLKYTSLPPGSDTWTPAMQLAEGEDWFVNWADFPSVVPMSDSVWAAHWLVYREDYEGYDIFVAISEDAGRSWGEPFTLNTDGTPTEHGFVTLFPLDDDIGAVWLDGRNMIVDGEFMYASPTGEMLGTSLRYARFGRDGQRRTDVAVDSLVCDCCQPDVALTEAGPILIYRDRTPEEVRDIVVRRMAGGEWQDLQPLPADHWTIEACPINGPAIAADGENVVAAWFSAVDQQPIVHYARSTDGGASFSEAIEIDAAGSFGYVDVELLGNGDAVVSWLRSGDDNLSFSTRRVSPAGELSPVESVAQVDISRPLDFPQTVSVGDRIIFLWTDYTDGSNVKTGAGSYRP